MEVRICTSVAVAMHGGGICMLVAVTMHDGVDMYVSGSDNACWWGYVRQWQ